MSSLKFCGIWLDTKSAFVILLENNTIQTHSVDSDIEDYRAVGGARAKTPWGPMDTVSEKKYAERRKHQQQAYFDSIIELVKPVNRLYIFGPAEMKDKLQNVIAEQPWGRTIPIQVEAADKMTDPQKIAKTKSFFGV